MTPKDLPDLVSLAIVVKYRSFTRAATELGVTRSALSHAVAGLEARLGVRLLNRTTRSVSPTEAAERLMTGLTPALAQIARAVDDASVFRDRPAGTVRLNLPRVAASLVLAPALPGFLAAYPDIRVEVAVDDGLVDIVAEGFDAGMRFGERLNPEMIAVPVGLPIEFAVAGSPEYFARRPAPKTPADLAAHNCLRHRMRASKRLFDWEFEANGAPISVAVDGALTLDSPELMLRAALDGVGLAYTALAEIQPLLTEGRLIRTLAAWSPRPTRLYLYYPNRHAPSALRALIDWLRR